MREKFIVTYLHASLIAASLLIGGCGSDNDHPTVNPPPPPPPVKPVDPVVEAPAGNKAELVFFNAIGSPQAVKPPEAPWQVLEVPDSEAVSNTKVLYLPDRVNEKLVRQTVTTGGQEDYSYPGVVEYQVELPKADSYVVFVHANFQDDCGNSVLAKVDDGPVYRIEYAVAKEFNTEYKWTCPLSEGNPVTLKLEGGKHTLTLLNREDGIKIDQVMICSKKLAAKFDQSQTPLGKK